MEALCSYETPVTTCIYVIFFSFRATKKTRKNIRLASLCAATSHTRTSIVSGYVRGRDEMCWKWYAVFKQQLLTPTSTRLVFRRVIKIAESDYYLHHVCLCLSAWNNSIPTGRIFLEIWRFSIFRKSVEKIQIWLKSNKYNGYCTWRPVYIHGNISPNSS
jgi:hypothetical protein